MDTGLEGVHLALLKPTIIKMKRRPFISLFFPFWPYWTEGAIAFVHY